MTIELLLRVHLDEDGLLDAVRADGGFEYHDDGTAEDIGASVGDVLCPEGCFTVQIAGRTFHVTLQEIAP